MTLAKPDLTPTRVNMRRIGGLALVASYRRKDVMVAQEVPSVSAEPSSIGSIRRALGLIGLFDVETFPTYEKDEGGPLRP